MSSNKEILKLLKSLPGYVGYSERIKKTLYYGKMPSSDRPSFPMTALLVKKFNTICKRKKLDRLDLHAASSICYDSCVTPCSVIISLLYLERLRKNNPEYLEYASPSHVFVVSMMVASKYLYDDGEEDEVYNDEWATSAAMLTSDLNEAERNFLAAIDWNLYVDMKSFLHCLIHVEVEIAKQQSLDRNFFTYTDLTTLSEVISLWSQFVSVLSATLTVCFVGYAATIFTVSLGTIAALQCNPNQNLCLKSTSAQLFDAPKGDAHNLMPQDQRSPNENQTHNAELPDTKSFDEIEKDFKGGNAASTFPSMPPVRFSTLRTITTALILASSTSPQSSSFDPLNWHECSLERHTNYSVYPFSPLDEHLPKNIVDFSICWNCCHNIIDFIGNGHVFPERHLQSTENYLDEPQDVENNWTTNSIEEKIKKANSTTNDSKLHYPSYADNFAQVIFRSEFISITTGNYILPSRKSHLKKGTSDSNDKTNGGNISHCQDCFDDDYEQSILSHLTHDNYWRDSVMTFLQWKSLPMDDFGEFRNLENLKLPITTYV